ncbi:MAG: hypothetical protein ACI9G1_003832 [Pirellulaceae bacterium]|jgi:hypothetical protein
MSRIHTIGIAIALVAICFSKPIHAQEKPSTITVTGIGHSEARPSSVEVNAKIGATANLVDDALKKYRANRRRLMESLKKLELKELSIRSKGVSIKTSVRSLAGEDGDDEEPANGAGAIINGIFGLGGGKNNAKIVVSEPFSFRLTGISELTPEELFGKVSKIIEVSKDAGVQLDMASQETIQMITGDMGQPFEYSLATYRIDDMKEVIGRGYASAMKNARDRAGRLAILSEHQLGKVMNVEEISVAKVEESSDGLDSMIQQMYGYGYSDSFEQSEDFSSKNFGAIKIEIHLSVTFKTIE